MEYKKIAFFTLAFLLTTVFAVRADRYRIIYANSDKIRIGDRIAKKGMEFDDKEPIVWTSDDQALRVFNLSNKRVGEITAKESRTKKSQSLSSVISRSEQLSTREWGTAVVVVDTVRYLLDTLLLDAGTHYGDVVTDEAIVRIGNSTITTKLRKTPDKREFIITRDILGGRAPRTVYLDIVETDKEWRYYIYRRLHIEVLPLKTD